MDASDTKELRGDAPTLLVQALDAFAQADGLSRNALVNAVLLTYVKDRAHKTSLAHRMLRGNPLYPESDRIPESHAVDAAGLSQPYKPASRGHA